MNPCRRILIVSVHTGALLTTLALAARAQDTSEFDVRSENRRFVAEVRHADIGRPDPARPRFEVAVLAERDDGSLAKQWSAPYAMRVGRSRHLLSDDGTTLVRVSMRSSDDAPLVEVLVKGSPLATYKASNLGLPELDPHKPSSDRGEWLARDVQALRIRAPGEIDANAQVDLLGVDGRVRTIDLGTGGLTVDTSSHAPSLTAEPPPPPEFTPTKPACVQAWSAPEFAIEGDPYFIDVRGSFPAVGWVLVGFGLRGDVEHGLTLVPCLSPPPAGTNSPQAVVGFQSTARIVGLAPSAFQLGVASCPGVDELPTQRVEVLPAGLVVSVRSVKERRSTTLFADLRASIQRGDGAQVVTFFAPVDTVTAVVGHLGEFSRSRENTVGSARAEAAEYEITWVEPSKAPSGRTIRRVQRNESKLEAPLRALVRTLLDLTPTHERTRYAIDVHTSRIGVRTGSSGLLSAFGHDHALMVQKLSGEVWADPADLGRATLFLAIESNSLAVVDNDSQSDRAEIELAMNSKVLESSRFPRITFRSQSVVVRRVSGATAELAIRGELSLHGMTREIELPVNVEMQGELLHAQGEISLRQSDYRIRATSAVGGAVKVDDKVKLTFDITARHD